MKKKSSSYFYNIGDIVKTKNSQIVIKECLRRGNNNIKSYKYTCINCNNEDYINEYNLKSGKGCNTCCPNPTSIKTEINSIYAVNRELALLFDNIEESKKFSISSGKVVKMKCPKCGSKKKCKISTVSKYGFSCDYCSDGISYGEKFLKAVLEQLNEKYIFHMRGFKWAKNVYHENSKIRGCKEYDFYLPDKNTIIEVHGKQHYSERCFSTLNNKKVRTLKEEKENDDLKERLAKKNNINTYIIIDCRESNLNWIKNSIISSKLSDIFDLNIINWNECERKALSSNIIECCKLYNEGSDVLNISKIMNVSKDVVRKWLNRCNEIGLCHYDGLNNARNANSKRILDVVNNIIYPSISEASRLTGINRGKMSNMVNDEKNKFWILK